MDKILRYGMQGLSYMIFMAVVWYFSTRPAYHQLEDDQAVITLSFTHATKLRGACRKLSQQELMNLAPNMRLPTDCPRERSPLRLELYIDGEILTHATLEPAGFRKDQGVSLFQRIKVKSGEHKLRLWMNDDVNVKGATYQYEKKVTLKPEQQLLIDFKTSAGGFIIN